MLKLKSLRKKSNRCQRLNRWTRLIFQMKTQKSKFQKRLKIKFRITVKKTAIKNQANLVKKKKTQMKKNKVKLMLKMTKRLKNMNNTGMR